jgi:hypothetical protein
MTEGKVEYGMTSDVDGWKSNLSYSYSVSGEFYSGVLPLKAQNEAAADEERLVNGRDRTWRSATRPEIPQSPSCGWRIRHLCPTENFEVTEEHYH